MDGVVGMDAMAACADEVGADAQVCPQGAGGVPVARDGLVPFRSSKCLFRSVVGEVCRMHGVRVVKRFSFG